jgi:hypothetical protein
MKTPHQSINEALKKVSTTKSLKEAVTITSAYQADDLLTDIENWIYSTVESLGYEDIQDFLEENDLEEAHAYMFKDIQDILYAIEYHMQNKKP